MNDVKATIEKLLEIRDIPPSRCEFEWDLVNDAIHARKVLLTLVYDFEEPFSNETRKTIELISTIEAALYDYIRARIDYTSAEYAAGIFDKKYKSCIFTESLIDMFKVYGAFKKPQQESNQNSVRIASKYESIERSSPRYAAWRGAVLLRDDFTCIKCGDKQGPLHAHHIEPYAQDPGMACSPTNGITFCKTCHKKFHSKYGNSPGKQELSEFLHEFPAEASQ